MKNLNLKHIFLLVCLSISNEAFSSALPENISELVDSSAPAVVNITAKKEVSQRQSCLLYTSPSPRDLAVSRMPSSA